MFRRVAIVVTLASVLIALPACDNSLGTSSKPPDDKGAAQPSKTYDSPQAVFDAAVAAAGKEDWPNFMACLTEDSRDTFTFGMMIAATFAKGFADFDKEKGKDVAKAIDDAMKKHGLNEETLKKEMPKAPGTPAEQRAVIKKVVESVKDKPAFVADIMAAMKKMGGKEADKNFGGELKDLKVDGDKATAKVKRKKGDKEVEEPIEFRKVGGGWKIELPDESMGPK